MNSRCLGLQGRIGQPRLDKFIKLLDMLLLMDEWMKQDTITAASLKRAQAFIPCFMEFYKATLNRFEGDGLKIKNSTTSGTWSQTYFLLASL